MSKLRIGLSRDIDFKLKKNFHGFFIENLKNKLNYNAIIITSSTQLDHKLINKSKKLKLIFIMSLHLISEIDLKKLRKDIKILWFGKRSKQVLKKINATPEFIFGLIILLSKNFLNIQNTIYKNTWEPRGTALLSFEKMLSNSKIGIIGYGRIGKKLKSIAKSFGIETLVYSNKKIKNKKSLNYIAENADFVTINLSLNSSTKNLIDKDFFRKMKKNSYFINTAKGEIVNYKHLLKYLGKNIKGAAVDVYKIERASDREFQMLHNYANKNNNLILTPHIAGGTLDSLVKLQEHSLDMIKDYFRQMQ